MPLIHEVNNYCFNKRFASSDSNSEQLFRSCKYKNSPNRVKLMGYQSDKLDNEILSCVEYAVSAS